MKKIDLPILFFLVVSLVLFASVAYGQSKADAADKKAAGSGIAENSDTYIIGPEDVLSINVWREDNITTKSVPVRMDGMISLPLLDDVKADGLTPLQLKDEITKLLKKTIDNPTVSVTVLEANSFRVYVNGEVKKPGVVGLRQKTSFVQLITMVGGFTEWANQKKILILHHEGNTEKRTYVNYKKIISGDQPDIMLNRGDIIIVEQ